MNGGFTPCRQLRPYSEREHKVFIPNQSSDDDGENNGWRVKSKEKETDNSTTRLGYSGPILFSDPHMDAEYKRICCRIVAYKCYMTFSVKLTHQ